MRGFRVFDDLFWKYMLAYKKRTIFTVLGITLSVILFFGSGTVYTSIYQAFYESSRKIPIASHYFLLGAERHARLRGDFPRKR